MRPHLNITMFGEFSITDGKTIVTDQMNRSKKIWTLLGYLILHRDHSIACSELIDLLWTEKESKDPSNALKVLIHRARQILEPLQPDADTPFILYSQERYGWNTQIPAYIDTDQFENAIKHAADARSAEEKLSFLMNAVLLYKGEFLKKNVSEAWVVHTANYYSTKFLKVAAEAAELLFLLKRYDELIELCNKALTHAPYDEVFYVYLLKALVRTNQMQKAMEQYQQISELFFREFGITPSEELTAIYKEIVKKNHAPEMNLEIIKNKLQEDAAEGALFCEYEMFKLFYHLKARSASRTGESCYIGLLSVLNPAGTNLPAKKLLNHAMDALCLTIRKSLRRGDILTRYSVNQFLLLLPGTTFETSNLVLRRVISHFRKDFPNLSVVLRHASQPVTPQELQNEK